MPTLASQLSTQTKPWMSSSNTASSALVEPTGVRRSDSTLTLRLGYAGS